jgi:hypothetical protein
MQTLTPKNDIRSYPPEIRVWMRTGDHREQCRTTSATLRCYVARPSGAVPIISSVAQGG